MRASLPALAILAALARPALAEDFAKLEVEVGEQQTGLGTVPRCDDLSVVAITADGRGVRGRKVGTTICSFDTSGGGGIRKVYRVIVTPPKEKPAAGGAGAEKTGG
ncbi:MAG TPA: hypothetical protein VF875_13950 [Anaeromyxobacter sp.]